VAPHDIWSIRGGALSAVSAQARGRKDAIDDRTVPLGGVSTAPHRQVSDSWESDR
jgi:hypothetical protein